MNLSSVKEEDEENEMKYITNSRKVANSFITLGVNKNLREFNEPTFGMSPDCQSSEDQNRNSRTQSFTSGSEDRLNESDQNIKLDKAN